ncbi:MAG: amino acid kinase, partial [Candidatus Thorarchaeota archaeon]
MTKETTVIKLGGSLLTDKTKPYTYRKEVLESVSREIGECLDEGLIQALVLLHGVGSYGHPPVLEHNLHKGFLGPEQLLPLSKTQESVATLRHIIVKELQNAGIPVCLMYPSSMVTSEKMRMANYFLEPLKGFVSIG